MKIQSSTLHRGFTLIETVIAIGVLAVLLTGFMFVFAPAAAGIKRAIGIQEADRLTSTLEQELVTLRGQTETTNFKTGFGKAFDWIKSSNKPLEALLIYQYRGSLTAVRADGTPTPVADVKDKKSGVDYSLRTMVRRNSDTTLFLEDLKAVDGGVYYVICKQLVFKNSQLEPGTAGTIVDPKTAAASATSDAYPEAVIAFAADFYPVKNRNPSSFAASFTPTFNKAVANPPIVKPIFSRNLAVRR